MKIWSREQLIEEGDWLECIHGAAVEAFENGTYATLGVQMARFDAKEAEKSEPVSYRPTWRDQIASNIAGYLPRQGWC